jgi:hypothetical protein
MGLRRSRVKCPKCGSNNPDDAEACSNCGIRFKRKVTIKRHVVLKDAKTMKRRKLTRMVLLPMVVSLSVAIGALLVAVMLFSPWVSPLATVHDEDGDGHPDGYDAAPRDPQFWAQGSALVVVTVSSNHTLSSHNYTLYINDVAKASGQVGPGESKVENVQVLFLIGGSNQAQVVLTMTATDGSTGQRQMTLENGMGYGAGFIIPS